MNARSFIRRGEVISTPSGTLVATEDVFIEAGVPFTLQTPEAPVELVWDGLNFQLATNAVIPTALNPINLAPSQFAVVKTAGGLALMLDRDLPMVSWADAYPPAHAIVARLPELPADAMVAVTSVTWTFPPPDIMGDIDEIEEFVSSLRANQLPAAEFDAYIAGRCPDAVGVVNWARTVQWDWRFEVNPLPLLPAPLMAKLMAAIGSLTAIQSLNGIDPSVARALVAIRAQRVASELAAAVRVAAIVEGIERAIGEHGDRTIYQWSVSGQLRPLSVLAFKVRSYVGSSMTHLSADDVHRSEIAPITRDAPTVDTSPPATLTDIWTAAASAGLVADETTVFTEAVHVGEPILHIPRITSTVMPSSASIPASIALRGWMSSSGFVPDGAEYVLVPTGRGPEFLRLTRLFDVVPPVVELPPPATIEFTAANAHPTILLGWLLGGLDTTAIAACELLTIPDEAAEETTTVLTITSEYPTAAIRTLGAVAESLGWRVDVSRRSAPLMGSVIDITVTGRRRLPLSEPQSDKPVTDTSLDALVVVTPSGR